MQALHLCLTAALLAVAACEPASLAQPPPATDLHGPSADHHLAGVLMLDASFRLDLSSDALPPASPELEQLQLLARQAFVAGISATLINLTTLEPARVSIIIAAAPSPASAPLLLDIGFIAPPGTTAAELDAAAAAVQQRPHAFLAGPFASRYGSQVVLSAEARRRPRPEHLSKGAETGIILACLALMVIAAGLLAWRVASREASYEASHDGLPEACWAGLVRRLVPEAHRARVGRALQPCMLCLWDLPVLYALRLPIGCVARACRPHLRKLRALGARHGLCGPAKEQDDEQEAERRGALQMQPLPQGPGVSWDSPLARQLRRKSSPGRLGRTTACSIEVEVVEEPWAEEVELSGQ
jgi:hypothetical protein